MKQSEAVVSQAIQLEAPKRGIVVWRNNVGSAVADDGRPVRYGLANTSAAMNKKVKSADLIGITPITITEDMVGQTVGVFTSIEAKHSEWKYKNTKHEQAQKAWLELVQMYGGIALFATGVEDIWPD